MERVAVVVQRPGTKELITMQRHEWGSPKQSILTIFPDGLDKKCSDFPLSGVTLFFNHRSHFILANDHKERWVLSDTRRAHIDLNVFGPEWQGCFAMVYRMPKLN